MQHSKQFHTSADEFGNHKNFYSLRFLLSQLQHALQPKRNHTNSDV